MQPVKLGFIGLGYHTFDYHFQVVRDLPEYFSVLWVCDPDPLRRDLVAKHEDIRRTGRLEYLLDDQTIEAVAIATPHDLHLDLVQKFLVAGKHVFCEKPLCTRKEQLPILEGLIDLAQEKRLVLTSCHPRRFDPCFGGLKNKLIALQERLGQVTEFHFRFHNRPAPVLWEAESNLLLDQVGHEIDLAYFILGPSKTTLWKESDSPTSYTVYGKRSDEIALHFNEHRCFSGNRRYFELEIVMARGRVKIAQSLDVSLNTELVQTTEEDFLASTTKNATDTRVYSSVFSEQMKHFARAVRDQEHTYLSREDLIRNTKIGIALSEGDAMQAVQVE